MALQNSLLLVRQNPEEGLPPAQTSRGLASPWTTAPRTAPVRCTPPRGVPSSLGSRHGVNSPCRRVPHWWPPTWPSTTAADGRMGCRIMPKTQCLATANLSDLNETKPDLRLEVPTRC